MEYYSSIKNNESSKMDGNEGHYVKGSKPDQERQVPCVLSHMWKFRKNADLNVKQ
jgi:hypothetical protein